MKQIIVLMMSLTLAACLQPIKTTPSSRYVLKGVSNQSYAKKAGHLTLLVSQLSANPGYRGAEIVYVNKPYQLHYFGKNSWITSPAKWCHAFTA